MFGDFVFKCVCSSLKKAVSWENWSVTEWKVSVFAPEPHPSMFLKMLLLEILLLKMFWFIKPVMDISFTTKRAQGTLGFGLRLLLSSPGGLCSFHIWFNW